MVKLVVSKQVKDLLGKNYDGYYNPSEDTPYLNPEDAVKNLPNYEKLTWTEKKLYNILPKIGESGFGKALQGFSEKWWGKALNYLDVLAEGGERFSGLYAQYNAVKDDPAGYENLKANLADAWYAGSLMADTGNVPLLHVGKDGIKFLFPNDLPGTNGIIKASSFASSGSFPLIT
jgi:hypothetical protein